MLKDPKRNEKVLLTHPLDASQWKALDAEYPSFGTEPRNIRLGVSTDGLNPFGNQSSTHSTWPMFVWIYNLPLAVHEEEVHTHEHAHSRAETTGHQHQSVSEATE